MISFVFNNLLASFVKLDSRCTRFTVGVGAPWCRLKRVLSRGDHKGRPYVISLEHARRPKVNLVTCNPVSPLMDATDRPATSSWVLAGGSFPLLSQSTNECQAGGCHTRGYHTIWPSQLAYCQRGCRSPTMPAVLRRQLIETTPVGHNPRTVGKTRAKSRAGLVALFKATKCRNLSESASVPVTTRGKQRVLRRRHGNVTLALAPQDAVERCGVGRVGVRKVQPRGGLSTRGVGRIHLVE